MPVASTSTVLPESAESRRACSLVSAIPKTIGIARGRPYSRWSANGLACGMWKIQHWGVTTFGFRKNNYMQVLVETTIKCATR